MRELVADLLSEDGVALLDPAAATPTPAGFTTAPARLQSRGDCRDCSDLLLLRRAAA